MSKSVPVNGQGGVNLLADSTGLAANELLNAQNLYPNTPGTIGTRKVMSFLEPFITQTALAIQEAGAAAPCWASFGSGTLGGFKAFSQSTVPGVSAVSVVSILDATNIEGSQVGDMLWLSGDFFGSGYNLSTVPLVIRGPNQYCICNVGNRTLVLDGSSSGYVISRREDMIPGEPLIDMFGSGTVSSGQPDSPDDVIIQRLRLVGAQDQELQPLFAVVRGNRLVFGAPDAKHPNTIFWGDPIDQIGPDSWRTVGDDVLGSRSFMIGTDSEGGIGAIWAASISPDASQPNTATYVFKRASMYMTVGEPGYSSDLLPGRGDGTINGSLDITRLNTSAGCVAPDSIVWTPQGMLWAGPDDIWMMGVGQIPHRVGTKIQPVLKAQPPAVRHKLHAAYHDGAYKLAVFADGQGPNESSACAEQWWLDLDEDAPPQASNARWFGPQVYVPAFAISPGTYAMRLDQRPGSEGALIAPQIAAVPGGFETSVQDAEIPVIVSFEAYGSYDSVLPTLEYSEWVASTAYATGAVVRPSAQGGREFIAVVGGTSDIAPGPDWDTMAADGGSPITLVDGTVTWIARSYTADDTNFEVPWSYLTPCLQTGLVLFDLKTREFSEPDAKLEKLLDGMDLVWKGSQPLALQVTLLPDQETDDIVTIIQTSQPSTSVDPMPFTLGSRWGKRFLPPMSDRRSRAPTFQVRLTQLAKFMVPHDLRYFTYFEEPDKTVWHAYPLVGGGDILHSTGSGTYSGTLDLDPNVAPVALDSALVAAAYPALVMASYGKPAAFGPDDGVPQSTPGRFAWGSGTSASTVGVPWDSTVFSGYDAANLPASIRADLLRSNKFWLSLMGFGAGVVTPDLGAIDATYALPNSSTAIVVLKEFSPRVRVFRRSPT